MSTDTDTTVSHTDEKAPAGRLTGRTALITGASRGIGAAVAKRFAAEGAHVILVARTVGGLEEVDDDIHRATGSHATLVPLDLRDYDKIDQMGYSIYQRFGKLDVLVGNAGVLETLGPVPYYDAKLFQRLMEVNVVANWRLIRSLDRLLRTSDAGRAMFVTAAAAAETRPYWGVYAMTKAALETMVKTYAAEIHNSPLKVNLIDPGVVRTRMREQAFPGEDPMINPAPETVAERFVELAEVSCELNGVVVKA